MLIQVTQADIDAGIKGMCTMCPVALALQRVFKTYIEVQRDWVLFVLDKRAIILPPWVTTWIGQFDRGKPVQPFDFELELSCYSGATAATCQPCEASKPS